MSEQKELTLTGDDAATLESAERNVAAAHQRVGSVREQFLAAEQQQLKALAEARQEFNAVIASLARKHGIDVSAGGWSFNLQDKTFRRVE